LARADVGKKAEHVITNLQLKVTLAAMAARAPWRESFGVSAGWDAEAVVRDRNARTGMAAMRDTARSNCRPGRLLQQLPSCPSTPAGEEMEAQICRDVLSFMTKRNPSDAARCRRIVDELGSCGEVVQLLASSNTSTVEAAARCLQALCFDHTDAVRAVAVAGAAEHLAAILGRPWAPPSRGGVVEAAWWRVQLASVELLQNLTASDIDTVARVTESRVAPDLARLLVEPADGGAQLRIAACDALTNLTWAPTAQQGQLLREASSGAWEGFIPQVLRMLEPDAGEEAQEAAAALLWSLLRARGGGSSRGAVEEQFVSCGATRRCISLMTGAASERLRVCCSAILSVLGLDMPNATTSGSVLASGSWQSKRGGPTRCTLPPGAGRPTAAAAAATEHEQRRQHQVTGLAEAWDAGGAGERGGGLAKLHPLGQSMTDHSSVHARPF
jgi:hypothetical protein